jgi:hypothetical protein
LSCYPTTSFSRGGRAWWGFQRRASFLISATFLVYREPICGVYRFPGCQWEYLGFHGHRIGATFCQEAHGANLKYELIPGGSRATMLLNWSLYSINSDFFVGVISFEAFNVKGDILYKFFQQLGFVGTDSLFKQTLQYISKFGGSDGKQLTNLVEKVYKRIEI